MLIIGLEHVQMQRESVLRRVDALWEALATRFWLSFCIYLVLAPVVELAFHLNVRRFLHGRSRQPHRTRSDVKDNDEVFTFWIHLLSEESVERIDDMVSGWFVDAALERRRSKRNPLVSSPKHRRPAAPRRGNVFQLIAWTLYNRDLASLSREELAHAEQIVRKIEARRGVAYLPGTDPKLLCMRHTLGELEMVWKPFCFYLGALGLQRLAESALHWRGFQRVQPCSLGGLEYWHLPAPTGGLHTGVGSEPIVLMHGVGGLTAYVPFCFQISSIYAVPILVPCFPSCTIRLPTLASPPPLATSELVAAIEAMVVAHATPAAAAAARHSPGTLAGRGDASPGFLSDSASDGSVGSAAPTLDGSAPPYRRGHHPARTAAAAPANTAPAHTSTRVEAQPGATSTPTTATFVAHSMGTAFLAATLRARPQLAKSALFVDPVCFLLYRRDVLYNFLYRQTALRRSWFRPSKWFHLALHRFITREPCMQCCFRRDFWWSQYLLHPCDIPCDAAVLLSGHDAIVNANDVHKYLLEQAASLKRDPAAAAAAGAHELRVEMHAGRNHGWLMIVPWISRGVLEHLAALRQRHAPR